MDEPDLSALVKEEADYYNQLKKASKSKVGKAQKKVAKDSDSDENMDDEDDKEVLNQEELGEPHECKKAFKLLVIKTLETNELD